MEPTVFEQSGVLGASTLRNIEDNDQVARLQGQDIDASTPLWQHDKAWIRRPAQLVRAAWQSQFLSQLSFITSHYAYFIVVCMVSSLIFWGSTRAISYVDSLFLVVSAMTAAGLVTVNLSQATTGQQVILFLLIIFGSRMWISICIVYSRKRRFDKRFRDIIREASSRRRSLSPPTIRRTPPPSPPPDIEATGSARNQEKDDELPYLSWTPAIGRNASSIRLTSEQRDELGGIEYRALKLLLVLLLLYFFLWQLLGCIALGAWISNNKPALDNSPKPWWLGIFNGVSAFNNSGMSLLDASMVPFQRSYFVVVTMGLMILAGHTAFPILLRFILWSQLMILRPVIRGSDLVESLHFLLDHPRRVYVYLWPRKTTRWLLFMLILLNSINWVGFVLFGLGNPDIESIPTGPRVLAGLFQALSVRFGGFHISNISNLHIGLQVLYAIAMSIPAHPIKTTSRRTRVYEERSLGIFKPKDDQDSTWNGNQNFIIRQFRYLRRLMHRQFARNDTWALMLAVFIITTIEAGQFRRDPIHYSVFNVMFEVMSAYGCVGVSVGLPDADCSFSGGWHAASKVILCAVMLLGRHRGLPGAIDRAVLLPSEALSRREDERLRVADREGEVISVSDSVSDSV
ncbi:hypothetical protein QQZ08_004295 [Neonectria magnoliae]|uniref:Potassium transport protein n=1 Tax=Neonectria magnoliae TaxID=2732573 RepID=A0ABR1I7V9_9HYPO